MKPTCPDFYVKMFFDDPWLNKNNLNVNEVSSVLEYLHYLYENQSDPELQFDETDMGYEYAKGYEAGKEEERDAAYKKGYKDAVSDTRDLLKEFETETHRAIDQSI